MRRTIRPAIHYREGARAMHRPQLLLVFNYYLKLVGLGTRLLRGEGT